MNFTEAGLTLKEEDLYNLFNKPFAPKVFFHFPPLDNDTL